MLAILAAVLGPAPAALAIVTASVNVLNPRSSWIRIFTRESQRARITWFQLGGVEQHAGTISMSMLACVIEATSSITQVLLFKFRQERASFRASHPKLATTRSSLIDLHPKIRAKVRAYQSLYVNSIADL
jgi:hypothetical protein